MSNAVYPDLPGIDVRVRKFPMFKTMLQETVSGRETAASFMAYPLWKFSLSYNVLRSDPAFADLQTLLDFFLSRRGRYDDFLFTDPDDSSVTDEPFGTGDGATAAFQLIRKIKASGFSEPMLNINGAPVIKVAGVTKTATTHYNIDSAGMVTFTLGNIPTAGQALTWSGAYYFRVRFLQDDMEFAKFLHQLFEAKRVEFRSFRP